MLTRATAKAPEQDDLFSEEVTLLFPALLALEGRLLGSAVRQQVVPSALTPCRLKPFTVRRISGFEANLKSGETLKIISAKTAASLDADLVVLARDWVRIALSAASILASLVTALLRK